MNAPNPDTTTQPTWSIDPVHSQVEFGVRHMMLSTVKGYLPELSGRVILDEDDPTASTVEVEIDASSIDTRNEDRDTHLRSDDFLNVAEHPHITFESTRIETDGEDLHVTGDLTIRGETREVVLDVERLGEGVDPWGNDRLGFRGTTKVNRKDFGLTWNQALEAGGVLVGDEVRITLDVQVVRDSEDDG